MFQRQPGLSGIIAADIGNNLALRLRQTNGHSVPELPLFGIKAQFNDRAEQAPLRRLR